MKEAHLSALFFAIEEDDVITDDAGLWPPSHQPRLGGTRVAPAGYGRPGHGEVHMHSYLKRLAAGCLYGRAKRREELEVQRALAPLAILESMTQIAINKTPHIVLNLFSLRQVL